MSTDILILLLMTNSTASHTLDMYARESIKKIFFKSQLKHFVDTSKRNPFYHSHISSHRSYASIVSDSCSDVLLKKKKKIKK